MGMLRRRLGRLFRPSEATDSAVAGGAGKAAAKPVALVADDDQAMRDSVALMLLARGFEVLRASSGEEALVLLDNAPRPPALLVSDVIMLGMDGPSLARAAAERLPEMPVIFISGYEHLLPATSRRLRRHQICLAKPFSLRALESALDRVALPAS